MEVDFVVCNFAAARLGVNKIFVISALLISLRIDYDGRPDGRRTSF